MKEILKLTNGIRVNIDDIVKCKSLEYRHGRGRTRIGRSSTISDRVRDRMTGSGNYDPYDAERYLDPSSASPMNRRTIDQLREREEDRRDRNEQREEER